MPNSNDLLDLLRQALAKRRPILADPRTTCCRLVHGPSDGLPGLQLDQYGSVLVAQLLEDQGRFESQLLREALAPLLDDLGVTAVYRKTYPRDRSRARERLEAAHSNPTPWLGEAVEAPLPVLEHGLTYQIYPYDGYATGLFLDARANRKRIRERAEGRRVLNLFAYTCGFSVAAVAGGATETVNVDAARRALTRGRENMQANDLDPDGHKWVTEDVLTYLGRITRRAERFDLIVVDPPSFGRVKGKKPFKLEDDLTNLLQLCWGCCAPGALILLSSNHRGLQRNRLEKAALRTSGGAAQVIERPKLPLDFAGDAEYAKSLWLQV